MHTVESLDARNHELYRFAHEFGLESYDGMDVGPIDDRTPKQRAADFYEKRIASSKARPASLMSLQSAIVSHFHKALSEKEVTDVLDALIAAGHILVNGKKVAYPDRG